MNSYEVSEAILVALTHSNDAMTTRDLCDELNLSESTIRKEAMRLCDSGAATFEKVTSYTKADDRALRGGQFKRTVLYFQRSEHERR